MAYRPFITSSIIGLAKFIVRLAVAFLVPTSFFSPRTKEEVEREEYAERLAHVDMFCHQITHNEMPTQSDFEQYKRNHLG